MVVDERSRTKYVHTMGSKKRNKRKKINIEMSQSATSIIQAWSKMEAAKADLPEEVRALLEQLTEVIDSAEQPDQSVDNLRKALAISMRILPSSERHAPTGTCNSGTLGAIEKKLQMAKSIARFSSARVKELEELVAAMQKKLEQLKPETDEPESPENSGQENEGVFGSAVVHQGFRVVSLSSLLPTEELKGKQLSVIERKRTDLMLAASTFVFRGVEYFDPATGQRGMYDFSHVGPEGFNVTHRACIQMVMYVAALGLPLARIERMCGGTPFSRQTIHRLVGYVAHHLTPVYLKLFDELSDAPVVSTDDTHTRVVEVTKALASGAPFPWDEAGRYANKPEKNEQDGEKDPTVRSVSRLLKDEFIYAFPKVKNPGEVKTQHLTSCVHGIPLRVGSRIVIYRSHLGSAGNLLESLLQLRRLTEENKNIAIVADLSTTNLVRNAETLKKLNITYAGCAAHARRPFFRYAEHDPEICIELLDLFKYLFKLEQMVQGRSAKHIAEIRSDSHFGSVRIWNDIKTLSEKLAEKFSASTPLGEGARYVTRNFEALTVYLKRGDLPASNNQTERLLRFEKLSERNTYGSKTIEGRMRMDVLRSVLTTCRFSGLDESLYLLKLLITPADEISQNAKDYTPHAIKKHFKDNPDDLAYCEKLLHATDYAPYVRATTNFIKKGLTPT